MGSEYLAVLHDASVHEIAAASTAGRPARLRVARRARRRVYAAIEPLVALDIAVQPDGVGVAGTLVQIVDVRAHQRQHAGAAPREGAERVVAGVGLCGTHAGAS